MKFFYDGRPISIEENDRLVQRFVDLFGNCYFQKRGNMINIMPYIEQLKRYKPEGLVSIYSGEHRGSIDQYTGR